MEDHVRRAHELAQAIASRLAADGVAFDYEVQPYEHGCMVHVDLADNDGFTFSVALVDPLGWIEIIERGDYHLRAGGLIEYAVLRARGARPYSAWKAALQADPDSRAHMR